MADGPSDRPRSQEDPRVLPRDAPLSRGAGLTFLRPSARAREDRHRRALLLGIAALLILSLAPVVGRHLAFAAHAPLTGIDHIGALCLIALHTLLMPVHAVLHLLVGGGLLYALWDRVRAWRRAHRALAPLDAATPVHGDAVWIAAQEGGVAPERVRVVAGLPIPAFTTGWLSPVVYVAGELAYGPQALPPGELTAVLAHEAAHVRRRDPLRFSVLRAMARTLFWIPALRDLAEDVADEAEVHADNAAAATTDPLTVASAIVALAAWRSPAAFVLGGTWTGDVVGFVRSDLLDRRVRRLAGEDTKPRSRVTRRSLAGAALVLGLAWVSGIVDVHPLSGQAPAHVGVPHAEHCDHRELTALAHLFCRWDARGGWITPGGIDCPHRSPTTVGSAPLGAAPFSAAAPG